MTGDVDPVDLQQLTQSSPSGQWNTVSYLSIDVLLDAAMDRSDVILPSLAMRLDDDDDDDDKIIF